MSAYIPVCYIITPRSYIHDLIMTRHKGVCCRMLRLTIERSILSRHVDIVALILRGILEDDSICSIIRPRGMITTQDYTKPGLLMLCPYIGSIRYGRKK